MPPPPPPQWKLKSFDYKTKHLNVILQDKLLSEEVITDIYQNQLIFLGL